MISVILLIVFIPLALSCIITNGLICYAIITKLTTDGAFKYYIFSMAITDILVGSIAIPMYLVLNFTSTSWTMRLQLYYLEADMILGICSVCHISLMAFDRMMAIKQPLFHRLHMRKRKNALKLLITPWLLAPLIAVIVVIGDNVKSMHITAPVFGIGVPFLFSTICYVLAIIAIRKRNRRFSQQCDCSNVVNNVRILKLISCILIVFCVCWLPFAIATILKKPPISFICVSKFLHYLNSTCNPFIYALYYPNYRDAVKCLLKRCIFKKVTRRRSSEMETNCLNITAV